MGSFFLVGLRQLLKVYFFKILVGSLVIRGLVSVSGFHLFKLLEQMCGAANRLLVDLRNV
jgi:hypothetical protein